MIPKPIAARLRTTADAIHLSWSLAHDLRAELIDQTPTGEIPYELSGAALDLAISLSECERLTAKLTARCLDYWNTADA